ncbi:MAG TPA: AbgT family transporter, partial [Vicinamibacterales bacterium]|nr:AbgT family transporter [Vicinamibacterales bacterium]
MAQTSVHPSAAAAGTWVSRLLAFVERGGNALPHPATLFAVMAALVIVVSAMAAAAGVSVVHPATGELVRPVSLLSIEGLHRILTGLVTNFTGFAPLGTVLVAMLGIAVADGSGLIGAALKLVVLSAPPRLLTTAIVFAGVMSNVGSEIGYVLLVPLAGVIFAGVGRHPVAGVAAAFAGVSGGYSANLLLGTVDPLLAGLSQEAARILETGYTVNAAANYYFMAASTFVITAAGTAVTEWVVEPRLGTWQQPPAGDQVSTVLSAAERRGLRYAAAAGVALVLVVLWGTLPAGGFLRDPQSGSLLQSPFMSGIVAVIFLTGVCLGLVYGVGAGTIRSDRDVMQ